MITEPVKYPRTPHLPWSRPTSDDKKLWDDTQFHGKEVVVTLKMDGENTSMYEDRYHARSLDSNNHYTHNYVKGIWGRIKHELRDLRVCGENLWAEHTIKYNDLEDYFYVFSIWDTNSNECFDWDTTEDMCEYLGLHMVPVIYRGIYNSDLIKQTFEKSYSEHEGYVVRTYDSFGYHRFADCVAKYVKPAFSQKVHESEKHWLYDIIEPNKLKNDIK